MSIRSNDRPGRRRALAVAGALAITANALWVGLAVGGPTLDGLRKAGSIRIGWATFKPMIYADTETGRIAGMWSEMTETMVSEGLGLKPQWVEGTWPTIVTGIQSHKWDVSTAALTDARSELADPTSPFVKVDYTMIVKDGSPVKSWRDLDQPGRKISVSQGSSTDQVVAAMVKQATIVRVRQEQALLELLSGKVDAEAATRDYGIQMARGYPGHRVLPDAFGSTVIGWYVPKGADDLRGAINAWIQTAQKRGLVRHLIDKYKLEGADPA